jgi:hypothetical protein
MIDDVERYAEIAAALASSDDRGGVLAQYGLTEEVWEAEDEAWQARLSEAVEAFEDDGVPEIIDRFNQAFTAARERFSAKVMSFDKFVEVTRALQRSHDVPRTLESHGVTFPMFIQANQHWAPKIATDPELAEKFRKAIQ